MPSEIWNALEKSRHSPMTDKEKEEQRRSFAYGNGKIEYDSLTRELVDEVANEMAAHGVSR